MAALASKALDLPPERLVYPTSVGFLLLAVWSLWSWRQLVGTLVDPYALFLTAALLFNGGQVILEIPFLNKDGLLSGRFSASTTLASVFLLILGISVLHLGAMMSLASREGIDWAPRPSLGLLDSNRIVRFVGYSLIAVSLTPYAFVMARGLNAVMSYGYLIGLFQQEAATGFSAAPNVLASLLIPGTLFLLSASERRHLPLLACCTIILLHSLINLFMGSRAPAVAALAAFLWLWNRSVRKLNTFTILIAAAAMLVLLPVIAKVRDLSGQNRSSSAPFIQAFEKIDNPAVSLLSEMGYSLNTVAYTIDLVPTVRPYDKGASYAYALLTLFPNLFWDVHPTVKHGLLGDWLVWTVDPVTAAAHGGLGFSFLAEAYLNFGWYGCWSVLLLVGFLLGRLSLWCREPGDPAKTAVIACILYFVLIFARGESAGVVRGVVWYSLLPLLCIRLLSPYTWPFRRTDLKFHPHTP